MGSAWVDPFIYLANLGELAKNNPVSDNKKGVEETGILPNPINPTS